MRELSDNELQHICGGIGFTFILAMLSGASGGSRSKTVLYDGMWWGTVGFVSGLPFMGIGALITGPIGFAGGVIEGFFGHVIGSLFYSEPQVQIIYLNGPQVQNPTI